MHGRKRPFTMKNGDIRRSYTGSVHGHRIRSETVRNGYRIRRSYKNTEWFKGNGFYSVYGAIRLPYTVVYYRVQPYTIVYGSSMRHFSDSHWKWVSIQHDPVDFDSFAQFAVFIQNLGYFLFRYSWIEHHLLYRTIYFLFCLL
jgi:hypothetical protein